MEKIKRYTSLDTLKCFCAFMVVFIHAGFSDNVFGYTFREICRIAVPIFFMISGYFSVGKDSKKIKLTIKKLLILQIVSDFAYFIFDIIKAIIMNEEIIEVISSYFTIKSILFNLNNVGWYIRALIYIYILFLIFLKTGKKISTNKISVYVITLIAVDLMLVKYSKLLFGYNPDVAMYEPITKFIATGLSCFMIGMIIKRKENKFKKCKIYIPIILFLLNLFEIIMFKYYDKNVVLCNYLCTIPFAMSVFSFAIGMDNLKSNLFSTIGQKYSTGIYLFHTIIQNIFDVIVIRFLKFEQYIYIRAIFIFIFTAIVVWAYYKIKERVKIIYE